MKRKMLWKPTETEVVYLADKLIKGTKKVSFEERFAASRKRCEEQEDARSLLPLISGAMMRQGK